MSLLDNRGNNCYEILVSVSVTVQSLSYCQYSFVNIYCNVTASTEGNTHWKLENTAHMILPSPHKHGIEGVLYLYYASFYQDFEFLLFCLSPNFAAILDFLRFCPRLCVV
jgi:hypothetical protein